MSTSLLQLEGITKQYGSVAALADIHFTIQSGEWVALMGASGSGKTTLLNIVGCLDQATSGKVWYHPDAQGSSKPIDITTLSQGERTTFRREQIGHIFQQFYLIPYLTAQQNVMLAQYFHSMAQPEEAADALCRVGLGDRLHHLPAQLSGGEQQRVCIARALINQPRIILADEPTGNLDEANELTVMGLLKSLHQEGHTILMVTHDPDIARYADRKIELHHGRIVHTHRHEDFDEMPTDEILEAIWLLQEQEQKAASLQKLSLLTDENYPSVVPKMLQDKLITQQGDLLHFTPKGEARAANIIRRHRLAERLLTQLFSLDEAQVEATACKFEHILSPEVTASVCSFLGHPTTCQHGKSIPRGTCCGET